MTTAVMRFDLDSYRRRTGWSMSTSVVVHALIMLWIVFAPHQSSQLPTLTEITLIEPGDLAPASAPAAAAAAARSSAGGAAPSVIDQSFRREARPADMTPEPESPSALADRIASRLAATQQYEPVPVKSVTGSALGSAWGSPATSGVGLGGKNASPLALTRGGDGGSTGPALTLTRGGSGLSPALATTGLPSAVTTAAPARGGDASARRALAGAMLAGPIADRPVVTYVRPIYPDWAKRDAVEGRVTLYFVVGPDGSVRENVLVQKTAGFEDFDESARTALRMWRFAPLRDGRTGEQWGTITFNFRLQEAG
jgi:TonB family protein